MDDESVYFVIFYVFFLQYQEDEVRIGNKILMRTVYDRNNQYR